MCLLDAISFYSRHRGSAVQYGMIRQSAQTTVIDEGHSQIVGL